MRERHTVRECARGEQRGRLWGAMAASQGHRQKLEVEGRVLARVSKEQSPADTLTVDFSPPEL